MHTLASTLCYLCILRCCSRFEKTLQETRLQEDSKGGIKRLTVPDGRRFTNPQWVVEVMKSLISDSLEAPPDQLNSFKMTDLGVCVRVCLCVFYPSEEGLSLLHMIPKVIIQHNHMNQDHKN